MRHAAEPRESRVRAPAIAARAIPRRGRAASDPFAARRDAFERYFARALNARCAGPALLGDAIRYAALSPGKRLRPLLALAACEAVGGPWRRALPAAAAVECVHAFSLVHDDLPALDDDDFRRGRPTTHREFGEATAILAGDALLAFAFEELTRLARAGVTPARVAEAVRRLARASGAQELVGGQVLDLAAESKLVDGAKVRAIHERKTGALFGAALALGAIAGGGDRRKVGALERAGRILGLAFQIHDDLFNAGSSLARLGKRAGTDARRGKATYPRAVGEEAARGEAARLLDRARRRIERFGPRAAYLARLVLATAERER